MIFCEGLDRVRAGIEVEFGRCLGAGLRAALSRSRVDFGRRVMGTGWLDNASDGDHNDDNDVQGKE